MLNKNFDFNKALDIYLEIVKKLYICKGNYYLVGFKPLYVNIM